MGHRQPHILQNCPPRAGLFQTRLVKRWDVRRAVRRWKLYIRGGPSRIELHKLSCTSVAQNHMSTITVAPLATRGSEWPADRERKRLSLARGWVGLAHACKSKERQWSPYSSWMWKTVSRGRGEGWRGKRNTFFAVSGWLSARPCGPALAILEPRGQG